MGADNDPGRKWRRIARLGAVACTLATVFPFERGRSLWNVAGELYDIATGRGADSAFSVQELLLLVFCCLAVPYLFCGPVYFLLCSSRSIRPGFRKTVWIAPLLVLWFATMVTPYVATYCNIAARNVTPNTVGSIMGALSIYLLICGMSFLSSRRAGDTPLYIFSIGLLPLGMLFLASTSLTIVLFAASSRFDWFLIDVPLGWLGALMLLVGWLKWWSAVKQAMREAPTATEPPQLQPREPLSATQKQSEAAEV